MALNQNVRKPIFHHDSEIWADKAGYYIYLPATFIYQWNAKSFPKNLDKLTGDGFLLDTVNNGILTKYPVGPAMLEAPFFIIGHELQLIFNKKNANGFTQNYQVFRIISTTFYYFLGIYLLGLVLLKLGHKPLRVIAIALIVITGTNVLYSSIWQPAMSHCYAFFTLSAFLYIFYNKRLSIYYLSMLAIATALMFDIRPLNVIIILPFFIYVLRDIILQKNHFARTQWILAILVFIVFAFPFFIYKLYLNQFHFLPYQGEEFKYIAEPRIGAILFSATNGIFIYTPAFALMLFAIVKNIKVAEWQSISALSVFFLLLSIYGAWWYPTLGCSIGFRALIDFLPLFTIVAFYNAQFKWNNLLNIFLITCCIYTCFLSWNYPGCLEDGKGTNLWDWREYMRLWTWKYI